MRSFICKNIMICLILIILFSNLIITLPSENIKADEPYDGRDLAIAILANSSWLISSTYSDLDPDGNRQSIILESLGTMHPTNGNNFTLFSTGIAGASIVTDDDNDDGIPDNPGYERGTWYDDQRSEPRDEVTLTMTLQVPDFMHNLYYDVQFFSAEYPDWVGSAYNDKLTITVDSPSKGESEYMFDVNSGYFVLDSEGIPGTGFDIYALDGNPYRWDEEVDRVSNNYVHGGADAGASDITPIGGATHPVSPNEQIIVTINLKDEGDNQFDSTAFIDNLKFTGWAKTDVVARKTYDDLNGGFVECGDLIKYTVTISNTGEADQNDNPGNEFEDIIPENTTYVNNSATVTSGNIEYNSINNMITWNGSVPAESAVSLTFKVTINDELPNGTLISNQGTVYWDSNEDGNNNAIELTDNPFVDDGIDQDNDTDTDDDDPTSFYVITYEPPDIVTENFDYPDDNAGCIANQTDDYGNKWFETDIGKTGSIFEVSQTYYYSSLNQSFKTQIRATGGTQYWDYNLSELESDLGWWETWFACGDSSEPYDLLLYFENSDEEDIAKIKLEYTHDGNNSPIDYVLKLYYSDSTDQWKQLYTDYIGGYLHNDWYKLRIEKNGDNYINYSLYRKDIGLVDFKTDSQLSAPFMDFARIKWISSKNPVVCPIFFWDDHSIGLIN